MRNEKELLRDKTIPTRRERVDRERSRTTQSQIRFALVAGNATKLVQEESLWTSDNVKT
jgi:hypothetical protein